MAARKVVVECLVEDSAAVAAAKVRRGRSVQM